MLAVILAALAAVLLAVLAGPYTGGRPRLAMVLALVSVLLAGGLYALLGSPEIPGQPLARREADGGFLSGLRRAAARAPDNPTVLYYLGEAELENGHVEKAKTAWRKLLARIPKDDPRRGILEKKIEALKKKRK